MINKTIKPQRLNMISKTIKKVTYIISNQQIYHFNPHPHHTPGWAATCLHVSSYFTYKFAWNKKDIL